MDAAFRCRINNVDYYQAIPNPEFDPPLPRPAKSSDGNKHKISVLRIFGATETGQKVLMHVHGVLQYTYIEYSGSLLPSDVDVAIRTLHLSIDHALAASYRQNIYDGKNRYVAHITLVKGIPFYGFHVGYKFYLKIYLLNPVNMTRLADLLREGAVMKRVLQPYESHMQYIAQWMCDYNLYGCSFIDCSKVKFRAPVPDYLELNNSTHHWHDQSIPPEMVLDEVEVPKQSHCALEVDVRAEDILNRLQVESRLIHHDFIERIAPLPIDKKLVLSMAGLWKDETRRRKMRMGLKDPNSTPFPADVLITMSADPRNVDAGGWIHEQEFRQKVETTARDEHEKSDGRKLDFTTFVQPKPLQSSVQTALESVKDLYSYNMDKLLAREIEQESKPPVSTQAIVDEAVVRGYASDQRSGGSTMVQTSSLGNTAPASNGHQTSSASDTSGSQVKSPISSGEFAELGIRSAEEDIKIEKDEFEIPDDYLAPHRSKKHGQKRARFGDLNDVQDTKRPRQGLGDRRRVAFQDKVEDHVIHSENEALLDNAKMGEFPEQMLEHMDSCNEDNKLEIFQPGGDPEDADITSHIPPASQSSQQSTLYFPVVKDPNDSATIARLSQQSNKSQSSQEQQVSTKTSGSKTTVRSMPIVGKLSTASDSNGTTTQHSSTPILQLRGLLKRHKENTTLILSARPPTSKFATSTMWQKGLPDVIYQDAYYSREADVPDRQREYAGREFKLESTTVPYLPDFDASGTSLATFGKKPPILLDQGQEEIADRQRRQRCTYPRWSIAKAPPRKKEVIEWLAANRAEPPTSQPVSQIQGATQANQHGFKYSQNKESDNVQHITQYMSIMSLEIHVNTRGSLAPNPEHDEIACIFWSIHTDDEEIIANLGHNGKHAGILVLAEHQPMAKQIAQIIHTDVEEERSELELLTRMVDIVRYYDPDILAGYEVHNSSWGYLIERARLKYDLNYCDEISRMRSQSHGRFGKDEDRWGFNHTSTVRVTGRHTVNIWRAMRGELNLLQYTMENVVYHLLHQRIAHYSFADLTKWYKSKKTHELAKVIQYFSSRVQMDLKILEANELVPRTSEQARLIGVDWFSVISRGSQFKVENIMFRIAKPENLILVSPSRRQVGGQNALECLPLVMEPQSDLYTSPVLVFDFQSLYPSVMIAYNYCYSTFLGRMVSWRGTNKMGFTNYQRQERLVELLKDHVNIAPNGIMYVKSQIRKSLLAKMLSEILETRVMVKSGMKQDKDDKRLQQLLNNRQLALKLIANVTYGYTSASFSGRMPCSEIADSIVQTGRETLEKAIALIHSVERWGAEVVYGDTDSLFIHLKGRTREQAFKIGEEISKTITDMNPRPVKLKFEKVYQPCVLLAKKRYVGFKYEHPNQTKPDFDAKGIETVRRDGTPGEQKIEENALKVLFRTADLSQVKAYFQAQCTKIMRGKISIQDFCFAKEVRLGTYSEKGPPPPGALISARRMLEDPRLEPQYGERVPYVVVTGGPSARLIDRCVAPEVLLNDAQQELDAEYYISKNIIPPLERIFNLVGANVRQWYDEMPKYQRIRRVEAVTVADAGTNLEKKTLESYMKSSSCVVCREPLDSELPICQSCFLQAPQSLLFLRSKLTRSERKKSHFARICRSCSGMTPADDVRCDSKDCPVFYSRTRQAAALSNATAGLRGVITALEQEVQAGMDW